MPAQRTAAIIDLATMRVDNMIIIGRDEPEQPDGFRCLSDSEWLEGETPAIGTIWNGDMPATFSEPVVSEQNPLADMTPAELLDRQQALNEEVSLVNEELARQLGG